MHSPLYLSSLVPKMMSGGGDREVTQQLRVFTDLTEGPGSVSSIHTTEPQTTPAPGIRWSQGTRHTHGTHTYKHAFTHAHKIKLQLYKIIHLIRWFSFSHWSRFSYYEHFFFLSIKHCLPISLIVIFLALKVLELQGKLLTMTW